MQIDGKFIGLLIFLLTQSASAVWFISNLSATVEHQGQVIAELQDNDELDGIDLLTFKLDDIRERFDSEISLLRETDQEIMAQHESIFAWMATNDDSSSGNPYGN